MSIASLRDRVDAGPIRTVAPIQQQPPRTPASTAFAGMISDVSQMLCTARPARPPAAPTRTQNISPLSERTAR